MPKGENITGEIQNNNSKQNHVWFLGETYVVSINAKGDIVGQLTLFDYGIWYVGIDVNQTNIEEEIFVAMFQVKYGLKVCIRPTPLEIVVK